MSARPPDLATATAARPEVACVPLSYVPFIYCKRAAKGLWRRGGDAIPEVALWAIDR